ncbi:hypothetical protein PanWU01x14_014300 [Parasponia andersonii]|uniref:Uncharacterized protein n=1 Tax=Parasponia andersonii TaxID=3476 RepID=A0A2P5E061_PARAD|nr:hypothetical protein PanWU01x14_014300 [Parasponia andersonii]
MRNYASSLVILQLLTPVLILQIGVLHEIWMMMQYPKVLTETKKVVWMRMVIKEATTSSNPRNGKRAKFSSILTCALETFNENAKRKTKLLERSMTISASHHLIDESVKAVDKIEGISGEVYAKAVD